MNDADAIAAALTVVLNRIAASAKPARKKK